MIPVVILLTFLQLLHTLRDNGALSLLFFCVSMPLRYWVFGLSTIFIEQTANKYDGSAWEDEC